MDKATARMNERDRGLAKHAASRQQGIDWENAKTVAKEENWTQRKLLEGIETLRLKDKGIIPLNQYSQMDQWKGVLHTLSRNDERTSDVR